MCLNSWDGMVNPATIITSGSMNADRAAQLKGPIQKPRERSRRRFDGRRQW